MTWLTVISITPSTQQVLLKCLGYNSLPSNKKTKPIVKDVAKLMLFSSTHNQEKIETEKEILIFYSYS